MFTNDGILMTAVRQSAADTGADPSDFLKSENVIVRSDPRPGAKVYFSEPPACNLVSYGSNIVAAVRDEYRDIVSEYISRYKWYHCFETPNMHRLDDAMREHGQRVCFMAEYFLPDVGKLRRLDCGYELRLLEPPEFAGLYTDEWSDALTPWHKELDVLAVGAYDGDRLIGLAGCSADCGEMRQIGVDVLPGHRRQGVASALTSNLAAEILERGKVPFYCCAWSNIPSARNALRSGFCPAWAEMTVKDASFVEKMNA